MRELLIKWLREALELETGEELYIPADNKQAQQDFYSALRKELNVMKSIDTEEAAKLRIFTTYRDSQFWVVIKKIAITPLVAYKKDTEGKISRVKLSNDKDKERLERLRKEEVGYAKEAA